MLGQRIRVRNWAIGLMSRTWGAGYATEAAAAMLRFGFDVLGLNRITACFPLHARPASGRVLEKIGMKREGELRQHTRKWERFEDLVIFAYLEGGWTPPAWL